MKLPFDSRSETDLLGELLVRARSNGLLELSDEYISEILAGEHTGNQYVLDLATHAWLGAELWSDLAGVYDGISLDSAGGEALDNLGGLLNVSRVSAKPAMVDISVSVGAALEVDVTVPEGTKVLIDEVVPDSDLYVTESSITLAAGSTSVSGRAVCLDAGFRNVVPRGTVRGLNGFSTLTVTNLADGVNGSNIEEDDVYRERIRGWASKRVRGSRALYEEYLLGYEGLDSFKLVPCYDGVGTMKIVCDTLQSELAGIASGVDENCKLETDYPTVCVLPESQTLSTLSLSVTLGDLRGLTQAELVQIIQAQVQTFVEGGTRRDGSTYTGMGIGEDFYPSRLVEFLMAQLPEVLNISTTMTPTTVSDLNKFVIETVSVSYV